MIKGCSYIIWGILIPQYIAAFRICNMDDYKPYGDGVTYDDEALQAALTDCLDGGQIVFNAGTYLLSPFNISSNMELYLGAGAVILASSEFERWPIVEDLPSYPPEVCQHDIMQSMNITYIRDSMTVSVLVPLSAVLIVPMFPSVDSALSTARGRHGGMLTAAN